MLFKAHRYLFKFLIKIELQSIIFLKVINCYLNLNRLFKILHLLSAIKTLEYYKNNVRSTASNSYPFSRPKVILVLCCLKQLSYFLRFSWLKWRNTQNQIKNKQKKCHIPFFLRGWEKISCSHACHKERGEKLETCLTLRGVDNMSKNEKRYPQKKRDCRL